MESQPKKTLKVVLEYLEDESDNDDIDKPLTSKKRTSSLKFKNRAIISNTARQSRRETETITSLSDSNSNSNFEPGPDLDLDPDSDSDLEKPEPSVKVIKRRKRLGLLTSEAQIPQPIVNKSLTIQEVLGRYATISTESLEPKKTEKSVTFKSDTEIQDEVDDIIGGEAKDSIPVILDSFQVQEIKDRRYRKQVDSDLENQRLQNAKEDYDEEFHFKTEARSLDHEDDMEGILLDQDERYADERLAIGKKEHEVQKHLHKLEIEEALYNIELTGSEDENRTDSDPAGDIHNSVNPNIDGNNAPFNFKLHKVPDYNTEFSSMKEELCKLTTLLESTKKEQEKLIKQLSTLKSERTLL